MRNTKRIIALILAIITIYSCVSIIGGAADDKNYVAKMYLCTRTKEKGHMWIYIENLTNKTITVGCYKLPTKQGVTVSTYATSRKDGRGNYYNIDSYCLDKYGSGGTTCTSMKLTSDQLKKVNEAILKRNDWTVLRNCVYFALSVWNSVAKKKIVMVSIAPKLIEPQFDKCKTPKFYIPTKSQCYKQIGTGSKATLKKCVNESFNHFVG